MKRSYTLVLQRRGDKSVAAFTLIEVLVVVAMIALIVTATAPMVFSTLVSTRLTSAGEGLAAQISLARQYAMSRNESVEIRLYQYEDPESPGSKAQFRALAIMASSTSSTTGTLQSQIGETFYLPAGIIIGGSGGLSPILSSGLLTAEPDAEKVIKRASGARYKAFKVNPDGGTSLESLMGGYFPEQTYLTVAEERVLTDDAADIPKNFFTIQIDPSTCRTTTFRP